MANKKRDDESEETVAEPEPSVQIEVPNSTKRPNDTPIVEQAPHHTNSTFASRAKKAGANKRVAPSEAETK